MRLFPPTTVRSPLLGVLGDSITVYCAEALHAELRHEWRLDIRAIRGYDTIEAADYATALKALHPDALVINLGTNDCTDGRESADTIADYLELVDGFTKWDGTPTDIVAVTVGEIAPYYASSASGYCRNASELNDWIRDKREFFTADWARATALDSSLVPVDYIHPATTASQAFYAALIHDALRDLTSMQLAFEQLTTEDGYRLVTESGHRFVTGVTP